ncbi:hypothetical protein GCM10022284_45130 [Streptomyces hundungensis]
MPCPMVPVPTTATVRLGAIAAALAVSVMNAILPYGSPRGPAGPLPGPHSRGRGGLGR